MKKILLTLLGVICSLGMWADYSSVTEGNTTTLTWDFGEYTTSIVSSETVSQVEYQGLTCVFGTTDGKDAVGKSIGFKCNGSSTSSRRYIKYTPEHDGKITVTASGNGTSGTRVTYIGTDFTTSNALNSVTTADGSKSYTKDFSQDLTAGTTYYIYFGGGGQAVKKVVYTYTTAAKTATSESFKGVKIGGTASDDYTKDGTTITLTNSYSVAPTVALVKTVTYDDESTDNVDVAVALTKDGDYFTGTTSIGIGDAAATYTVKAPYTAPTTVAVTWSNQGGWGMRSVTTSTDKNTKLTSGVEVETGTQLIFTTDTGAGWDLTWYVNDVKQEQTTSPLTITINAATEVKSVYVARKKFTFSDNAKAKAYAAADGKITLSANNFSYEAGKTVDYWTNGEDKYYVGKEYTLTDDVELTPHFVDNIVALGDAASTVTWGFGYKADNTACPVFTSLQSSNSSVNYVAQATVLGQNIDANLVCDPTNGKLDNERRVGSGNTQTNKGTKFTIPVIKGSVVTIVGTGEFKASGKTASTINNSTDYTVTNKTTATYTYSGEAGTIEYVVGDDNTYLASISVTYPDNSGRKYATWTANKTSGTSTLETASKTSDIENVSNLTDMTLNGELGYVSKKTANGNAGPGITTTAEKTDGNYVSMTFDVANGCTFTPSVIALNMVSITDGKTFEVELSDGNKTVSGTVAQTSTSAIPSDVYILNATDTKLSGTVTLKMWVYGGTSGFRIGSINVAGTVDGTPAEETITTNENGVASYVTKNTLDFTNCTDIKAYVCTSLSTAEGYVTLTKATIVPAGEGIIVKATDKAVTSHVVPVTTESAPNGFKNLFNASTGYTVETDPVYCLNTEGNFQQVATGVTIPSGKAYLLLGSGNAKVLTVKYDDAMTTAIQNVDADVNANNGAAYNLAGQRVNASAKGIVIINGKKYINK